MEKSSKSIVAIGMGLIIMAVAYFGAWGQWAKLGDNRAAFDVSKEANVKLKQAEADASAFLSRYENNLQEADLANRALPMGDPDVPTLLDNFSKMVTESGLSLDQMNIIDSGAVDAAPERYSIQPIDLDVQMKGTYEAFNDFLLRMQRNLRLVDLVSLNIADSQAEEGSGRTMAFILRFRTYYQK